MRRDLEPRTLRVGPWVQGNDRTGSFDCEVGFRPVSATPKVERRLETKAVLPLRA